MFILKFCDFPGLAVLHAVMDAQDVSGHGFLCLSLGLFSTLICLVLAISQTSMSHLGLVSVSLSVITEYLFVHKLQVE